MYVASVILQILERVYRRRTEFKSDATRVELRTLKVRIVPEDVLACASAFRRSSVGSPSAFSCTSLPNVAHFIV